MKNILLLLIVFSFFCEGYVFDLSKEHQFSCSKSNQTTFTNSIKSLCQFTKSCSPPYSNYYWNIISPYDNSPYNISLKCNSYNSITPFSLNYITSSVNSSSGPQCNYLIQLNDCIQYIPNPVYISAANVWNAINNIPKNVLPVKSIHPPLLIDYQSSSVESLCDTALSGGFSLACRLPYVQSSLSNQAICSLSDTISFFCYEHKITCTVPSSVNSDSCESGTYASCSVQNNALQATWTTVSVGTIRRLIEDSISRSFSFCPDFRLSSTTFNCQPPRTISSGFCSIPANFSNVQPYCGANGLYSKILCYSENGRNFAHNCLYPVYSISTVSSQTSVNSVLNSPALYLSCQSTFDQSILFQDTYDRANAILSVSFPSLTLLEYQQLFCNYSFSDCPLWQIDVVRDDGWLCNTTLRQQFRILSNSNPSPYTVISNELANYIQIQRRLLSIVDYLQNPPYGLENNPPVIEIDNFSPFYEDEHIMISDIFTISNSIDPIYDISVDAEMTIRTGNSACLHNYDCFMNYKSRNASIHVWTAVMNEPIRETIVPQNHSTWRRLLQTNSGSSGSWTPDLFSQYASLWCAYGRAEQQLCKDIASQVCRNPGNELDCTADNTISGTSVLDPSRFCAANRNSKCSIYGIASLNTTVYCPASSYYYHKINCQLFSTCTYVCSASNDFFTMVSVTMFASDLFDTDDSSAICQTMNNRWQYVPGSCVSPYEHTSKQLCYYDDRKDTYMLQCGSMTVNCSVTDRINIDPLGYPYYSCITSNSQNQFGSNIGFVKQQCSHGYHGMYSDRVPHGMVTSYTSLDQTIQCANLMYYVQQQSSLSLPFSNSFMCCNTSLLFTTTTVLISLSMISYASVTSVSSGLAVTIDSTSSRSQTIFGTLCVSKTRSYPSILQFKCGNPQWSTQCSLQSTIPSSYKCFNKLSNESLQIQCSNIDPLSLLDSSNILRPLACMSILRNCHYRSGSIYPQDFFNYDITSYESDQDSISTYTEFRIRSLTPSPIEFALPDVIPTFTTGVDPLHNIFCSRLNSRSNRWYRCSNDYSVVYTPSYIATNITDPVYYLNRTISPLMKMNCLIRSSILGASLRNWTQVTIGTMTNSQNQTLQNSLDARKAGVGIITLDTLSLLYFQTKPYVFDTISYYCVPFTCDSATGTVQLQLNKKRAVNITTVVVSNITDSTSICPFNIVQQLSCQFPAQTCTGIACQLSVPDSVLQSDECKFNPLFKNVTCNGYKINCALQTTNQYDSIIGVFTYQCSYNGLPSDVSRHYELDSSIVSKYGWTTQNAFLHAGGSLGLSVPSVPYNKLHNLSMNCLVDGSIVNPTNSFVSSVSSSCQGLTSSQCKEQTICKDMGLYCYSINQITCGNNGKATEQYPYCQATFKQPTLTETFFTCNVLGIQCYLPGQDSRYPVEANSIFCTSMNSDIWQLQENTDGLQDPLNVNLNSGGGGTGGITQVRGCLLSNSQFYQDSATRCSYLYDNCNFACKDPKYVAQDGITSKRFCDRLSSQETNFQCDEQWIKCEDASVDDTINLGSNSPATSETLRQHYLQDPNFGANNRIMNCRSFTPLGGKFNNTLNLECQVNKKRFLDSYTSTLNTNLDISYGSCGVLLSECRANSGTIKCADGWKSTEDQPLCTTPEPDITPSSTCNCDVWWSSSEGLNRWSASMQQGAITSTYKFPGMTCESRGFISVKNYLNAIGKSELYNFLEPYQKYWCLESVNRPSVRCATLSGKRVPLCTIECPIGLNPTTIYGSTSIYCCNSPSSVNSGSCSLIKDSRQCVLGQHDSSYYSSSGTTLDHFPDNICPENPLSDYNMYPMSTATPEYPSMNDTLAQARQLCFHSPTRCYGITIIQSDNEFSWFANSRPIQLTINDLNSIDSYQQHSFYKQRSYHLHPSFDVKLLSQALILEAPTSGSNIQSANTFILERNHGTSCVDQRLSYTDFVTLNPLSANSVNTRFRRHLKNRGYSDTEITSLFYSSSSQLNGFLYTNNYKTNNQKQAGFVVDLNEELAYDWNLQYTPQVTNNFSLSLLGTIALQVGNVANWTANSAAKYLLLKHYSTEAMSVAQGFVSKSNVVNTCILISANPPSDLRRYSNLFIRKHSELVNTMIPLWGTSDNLFLGQVWNYKTSSQSTTSTDSTQFVDITYVKPDNTYQSFYHVGYYQLIDTTVQYLHFNHLDDVYRYMAWRTMVVLSHRYPVGYKRPFPNVKCTLNTPLWIDYDLDINTVSKQNIDLSGTPSWSDAISTFNLKGLKSSLKFTSRQPWQIDTSLLTSVANFPLCSISRCALPVDPAAWKDKNVLSKVDTSILPSSIYPNIYDYALYRLKGFIPCSGHGICISSPFASPGQGTCKCNSEFVVYDPISPFLDTSKGLSYSTSKVPTSLKGANTCLYDKTLKCTNPLTGNTDVCSNNGECVTSFTNQQPSPSCQCGSFPNKCNLVNGQCEQLGKPFQINGFQASFDSFTQCQVPQDGCRYDYGDTYFRPANAAQPKYSYSCIQPRVNSTQQVWFGQCVQNSTNIDTWSCQCSPGRYGKYCEYTSLQSKCFDQNDKLYQYLSKSQPISSQTMCVFNPYMNQFETVETTSIPKQLQYSYIPSQAIPCQGLICSGIGQCRHDGFDNPPLDLYVPSSTEEANALLSNPYTIHSNALYSFSQAVKSRIYNSQKCICPVGYTGAYCQYKDCIGGCGTGYCVRSAEPSFVPYCACPSTNTIGIPVLVKGTKCELQTCEGRGILQIVSPSAVLDTLSLLPQPVYKIAPTYKCNCTAPYYQGPNPNELCSLKCVGFLEYSVKFQTNLCMCYNSKNQKVQCNQLTSKEFADYLASKSSSYSSSTGLTSTNTLSSSTGSSKDSLSSLSSSASILSSSNSGSSQITSFIQSSLSYFSSLSSSGASNTTNTTTTDSIYSENNEPSEKTKIMIYITIGTVSLIAIGIFIALMVYIFQHSHSPKDSIVGKTSGKGRYKKLESVFI
jgi:hypothetical protein